MWSIVLFVGLGLLTTIGIAWISVFTVRQPQFYTFMADSQTDGGAITVIRRDAPVLLQVVSFYAPDHILTGERTTGRPLADITDRLPTWSDVRTLTGPEPIMRLDEARGWPVPALRARFAPGLPGSDVWTTRLALGGIPIGERRSPMDPVQTGLPLIPIWPGVVIDTLLFALAWFLPLALWGVNRGVRRRLAGRCPKCGYDLRYHHSPSGSGGSPVDAVGCATEEHHSESGGTFGCPECGWRRNKSDDQSR